MAVLDDLEVITNHSRPGTGRLFPYVVGSGEPVAALGDLYASFLNQNLTAWRSAPAAVAIERTVVRWLAEAVGCSGFTGSLTSGGSLANLMGLAMAREAKAPANEDGAEACVAYASQEVHMSIPKALALLGVGLSAITDNALVYPFVMAPLGVLVGLSLAHPVPSGVRSGFPSGGKGQVDAISTGRGSPPLQQDPAPRLS